MNMCSKEKSKEDEESKELKEHKPLLSSSLTLKGRREGCRGQGLKDTFK